MCCVTLFITHQQSAPILNNQFLIEEMLKYFKNNIKILAFIYSEDKKEAHSQTNVIKL